MPLVIAVGWAQWLVVIFIEYANQVCQVYAQWDLDLELYRHWKIFREWQLEDLGHAVISHILIACNVMVAPLFLYYFAITLGKSPAVQAVLEILKIVHDVLLR
ncbi:hypothetical protein CD58_19935 [Pseudomonas brassicacearum]|nr:hypothetical protein CD58_19935 [Pseudomonas brassicacearum]